MVRMADSRGQKPLAPLATAESRAGCQRRHRKAAVGTLPPLTEVVLALWVPELRRIGTLLDPAYFGTHSLALQACIYLTVNRRR